MTAARARSLHKRNPALSAADLASKLGMPRQAVERALASTGKKGRPVAAETRVVRLSAELLNCVEVERGDTPLRTWVEAAISARLLRRSRSRR